MGSTSDSELLSSRKADFWKQHRNKILGAAKLIVSFYPGGAEKIEIIDEEIIGSDLNISRLKGGNRLLPLSGFKIIGENVFPEGFTASFSISHNEKGNETIILRRMSLNIEEYLPHSHPEYSYQREGENIIGEGIVKPHQFFIILNGRKAEPACWTLPDSDEPVWAKSDNFFDMDPPQLFTFSKNEGMPQEIIGTVKVRKAGIYKLSFSFNYSIAARTDIEYISEPISACKGS